MHGLGRGRDDGQTVGPAIGVVELLDRMDVRNVVGLAGELHSSLSEWYNCHCEERSDAAISIEVRTLMEIAASLRSSQ